MMLTAISSMEGGHEFCWAILLWPWFAFAMVVGVGAAFESGVKSMEPPDGSYGLVDWGKLGRDWTPADGDTADVSLPPGLTAPGPDAPDVLKLGTRLRGM
jgi:hypothetical protein